MAETKAFLFSASIGPDKALSSVLFLWHRLAICHVPLGSVPAILIQAVIVLAACILRLCVSLKAGIHLQGGLCKKLKGQNLISNGDV